MPNFRFVKYKFQLVDPVRIELTTPALKERCSYLFLALTTELRIQINLLAVYKGVEPLSQDRQSSIINRYTNRPKIGFPAGKKQAIIAVSKSLAGICPNSKSNINSLKIETLASNT